MTSQKKLQVFVSSTYEDLKDERQAAVQAILTARHIPAGMELFTASDQSQMDVIRRWIDESDVFLLILGGRYGSIEPESGKSYIELEYEYAQKQRKPFFAVVIDDNHLEEKVKQHGSAILAKERTVQWEEFRKVVKTKLVRFFRDPRDIKLAIYETLADFAGRDKLTGWIPGDQAVNSGAVAEEIARLAKENATLREQLSTTEGDAKIYSGLSFTEMVKFLKGELAPKEPSLSDDAKDSIFSAGQQFDESTPTLFHVLWAFKDKLASGTRESDLPFKAFNDLCTLGFVVLHPTAGYSLTDDARKFLLRFRYELLYGKVDLQTN